jgi:hypothetical protein
MPQPGGYGASAKRWRKRKTMPQAARPCRKPKTMTHGKNHAAE